MIEFVADHWPSLVSGALLTLAITAITAPLFISLGVMVAIGRSSGTWWIERPLTFYVEVFRGTPFLTQIFWIFFALPFIGITLDPVPAGIIALTLNFGAYASEVVRAGIVAVPAGQREAALVLGMGRWLALRRVILPQTLVLVTPALGNHVIELFKATSLLSLISVGEIVFYANRLLVQTYQVIEVWVLVAIFYFVISFPSSLAIAWFERRSAGWGRSWS